MRYAILIVVLGVVINTKCLQEVVMEKERVGWNAKSMIILSARVRGKQCCTSVYIYI